MTFPELAARSYQKTVYRNIFTCAPTQQLMDDVAPEADWDFIDRLVQASSGIDHGQPQHHRPFQYAEIYDEVVLAVFRRENWQTGRFSDGVSFGVWYGTEEERTSVYEACWTSYQFGKDNVLPKNETYTTDRRMFQANAASDNACDLVSKKDQHTGLIHPHDYGFCQQLGAKLIAEDFHLLRTASARKPDGICTPIFSPDVLSDVAQDYLFKIHVNPDDSINVSGTRDYLNFTITVGDIEDPYQVLA